jgi:hypothetical protein
MGRTLIGAMVSNSPVRAVIARNVTSPIMAEEAAIASSSGVSGWHYGASRCHYLFMDDPWGTIDSNTRQAIYGNSNADHENNRLTVATTKPSGGFNWAQTAAASPTVNVAAYNDIVARGAEIAAYQATYAGVGKWGSTFVWSPEHEPNTTDKITANGGSVAAAAANWQAMAQNIYELWVAEGVQIWQGATTGGVPNNDWSTTQEGMIMSLCLVAGAAGGTGGANTHISAWWGSASGTGAGNTWMDSHCILYGPDPYNVGPAPDTSQRMKTFEFLVETPDCKTWMDNKSVYQASQGRSFLQGMFETGTQPASAYPATPHSSWLATGLAATPENYVALMRDYIRDHWQTLNLCCWWDDTGSTGHSYEIDSTLGMYNAVYPIWTGPVFNSSLTPLPTAGVSGATELGMVTA